MPQESAGAGPTLQEIHEHLAAISKLLHQPHRLDAAAQAALADFLEELDKALKQGSIPNEETARLAAAASHFAETIHRDAEAGVLKSSRDRLEAAAVAAENNAPMVAGLARRFMDALSNIGI